MTPFRRRVVGREVQTHGCAWTDDGRPLAPNAGPAFTVVVPVWNTHPGELRAMYASLCSQRYSAWELSTVDDASTRPETLAALHDIAGDPRVRVTRLDANSGIVGATTAALANARGEGIAFVDHEPSGDLLVTQAFVHKSGDLALSGREGLAEQGPAVVRTKRNVGDRRGGARRQGGQEQPCADTERDDHERRHQRVLPRDRRGIRDTAGRRRNTQRPRVSELVDGAHQKFDSIALITRPMVAESSAR